MKKSTLVRNDKPHAVKMAEGTNVAQRKNTKKTSAPEAPAPTLSNFQKIAPVKAPKTTPLVPPPAPSKPVRAKARLRAEPAPPPVSPVAKPKAPVKASVKPRAKAPPAIPPAAPPAAPPEPVWEQDNPIKSRIDKLKVRNAQLTEQIERLQNASTARGKRP